MGDVFFAAVDGRRGPALGVCESCHRPIWRAAYASRGTGERCGGRILVGRQPGARPAAPARPGHGEDPDQLRLFEVVVIRVKA